LARELAKEVGPYVAHAGEGALPSNLDRYLGKIKADTALRVRCALYLARKYEPQFFMFVFGGLDPLQHQFFNHIAGMRGQEEKREKILSVYTDVDRWISEIVESVGQGATIIFMSDHGFGPLKAFLHLNNWLLARGYLSLKGDPLSRTKRLLFRAGFTPEMAHNLTRRLGLDLRRRMNRGRAYQRLQRIFLSFKDIDWERTKAYALGHIGQIYINLRGRQPQGIVEPGGEYEELRERIKSELLALVSPITGERAIERVYKKEEIYWGESLEQTPDLLLMPKGFSHVAFGESEFGSNLVFGPTLGHTGHHRMNGMLILHGPQVKPRFVVERANIVDLAPTILYLLGCPIPKDMDGRVLSEAFQDDFLQAHAISYSEPSLVEGERGGGYSEAEEAEVRERLKGLGYIA
jgi:predicted AlkP superfamily phosphohydrolase/phosphomutase